MKRLESKRMVLRPWRIEDLDDLHQCTSDEQVAKFAGFNVRQTKKETLKILKQFIGDSLKSLWAIELKKDKKDIGWIELYNQSNDLNMNSKELGFVLSQEYWGKGLMTEAVKLVLNYVFNIKKVNSIICSHFLKNIRSRNVITKCGFKFIINDSSKCYYYLSKN
ncbi:GNAT family N-acetyltransferase [Clostridium taeniosporum]|uniref:N-acetyltransferase n=1 Tax=Clostridium taeniosporum TaxID=394958 RepID=A0A1D7XJS5_9CLOT|nr:GNAT family N-acetyltransferase [Clostridium taeniosporum]AOR23576.1 N-acetyltransferase [Clostridium taeniosporum]